MTVVTEGRQAMILVSVGIGFSMAPTLIVNEVTVDKPGRANSLDSMASVCVGKTCFSAKSRLNMNVGLRDCALEQSSKQKPQLVNRSSRCRGRVWMKYRRAHVDMVWIIDPKVLFLSIPTRCI